MQVTFDRRSKERSLRSFLDGGGLRYEHLLEEVEASIGDQLLVVASGSVLQGFGNSDSDIDLHVVVDRPKVTRFPVMSFDHGRRVDITLHAADALQASVDVLQIPWPTPGAFIDRASWQARKASLDRAMLLAVGLTLWGEPSWVDWISRLRAQWFVERVTEWWIIEATRRVTAASWLTDRNPMLAAQVYCDAVLAGLESRACAAGEMYCKQKWLGERFRALGDDRAVEMLQTALSTPTTPDACARYHSWARNALDELAPCSSPPGLAVHLSAAEGMTETVLDDRLVISRWGMRCVELPGGPAALTLPWVGPLAPPDSMMVDLFVEEFLWMGVGLDR